MAEDDGFLARWSRRKAEQRSGRPPPPAPAADDKPAPPARAAGPAAAAAALSPEAAPAASGVAARPVAATGPATEQSGTAAAGSSGATAATKPELTMEDVQRLTKDSDFSAFTAPHVDPRVRNAAMKKLFHSDPHFNLMDGLDTYIDDYGQPDPLPRSMLRQMQMARMLGLLDDEVPDQPRPAEGTAPAAGPDTAADPAGEAAAAEPSHAAAAAPTEGADEDADLQLQPDDAARCVGADACAERPGPADA